jgi:succinyl-diaminopimelate desuccinylase
LAPDFALEVRCNAEAFLTRPGRLTEVLAASVEEVTGSRPALNTLGGTSDARFVQRYCPVVEFGLVGATLHQADERVTLDDVEGLTRIYEALLRRYLVSGGGA